MAVRLFFTNWSVDSGSVTTPIMQWIEAEEAQGNPVPSFDFLQTFYPTAAVNGRPDKTMCVVMVKGSAGIEVFDQIAGVYMIPPEAYSAPMTNLIRNRFRQVSDYFGIPANLVDDAQTNGEAIDRVIRYMEPASSGLDEQFAIDNDQDFG